MGTLANHFVFVGLPIASICWRSWNNLSYLFLPFDVFLVHFQQVCMHDVRYVRVYCVQVLNFRMFILCPDVFCSGLKCPDVHIMSRYKMSGCKYCVQVCMKCPDVFCPDIKCPDVNIVSIGMY
jgi:hypothetical protein